MSNVDNEYYCSIYNSCLDDLKKFNWKVRQLYTNVPIYNIFSCMCV